MGGSVNPFDQASNMQPFPNQSFASVSNPFENISPFEQASMDESSTTSLMKSFFLQLN